MTKDESNALFNKVLSACCAEGKEFDFYRWCQIIGEKTRKDEREACAKLCDEQSDKDGFEGGYANECAELIRSRGIDGAKVGEVGVWCEK